jgi:fatty acid desaturase
MQATTNHTPSIFRHGEATRATRAKALVWMGIALFTGAWVWMALSWVPNIVGGVVLAIVTFSIVAGLVDWASQGGPMVVQSSGSHREAGSGATPGSRVSAG